MRPALTRMLVLFSMFLMSCAEVHIKISMDTGTGTGTGPLRCDATRLVWEIPGLKQDTGYWCWAASAQAVMEFHGYVNIKQCELVDKARPEIKAMSPVQIEGSCCDVRVETQVLEGAGLTDAEISQYRHVIGNHCNTSGSPGEVFERYHITYKVTPPYTALTWESLQYQLCEFGPFVFGIEWVDEYGRGDGRHTGVARGYHLIDQEDFQRVVDMDFHDGAGFKAKSYEEFVRDANLYRHYVDFIYIRPGS